MKKMIIMAIMAFVMMFSGVNTNTNCELVGMKQKTSLDLCECR